jgi:RNA polymerase sigma-70 factor (ECF subfamily)
VRRVAIRMAVRVLRRDRLRPSLERKSLMPASTSLAAEGGLLSHVAQLPRNQRLAVVLHYVDDLPVSEVAAVLGCAEATARVHLHRGRRRLAELIAGEVTVDG